MVEATAAYERSRDVAEALAKAHPTDPVIQALLVESCQWLRLHLGRSGRTADGLAALGRALEVA
jgi:hypothetical protein